MSLYEIEQRFYKKCWHNLQNEINKIYPIITRIIRNFFPKISKQLEKNHGLVTLEDLKINNMSKSAKSNAEKHAKNLTVKSGLNRRILFQGFGIFAGMLKFKCCRVVPSLSLSVLE